jgi:hypothetical protein
MNLILTVHNHPYNQPALKFPGRSGKQYSFVYRRERGAHVYQHNTKVRDITGAYLTPEEFNVVAQDIFLSPYIGETTGWLIVPQAVEEEANPESEPSDRQHVTFWERQSDGSYKMLEPTESLLAQLASQEKPEEKPADETPQESTVPSPTEPTETPAAESGVQPPAVEDAGDRSGESPAAGSVGELAQEGQESDAPEPVDAPPKGQPQAEEPAAEVEVTEAEAPEPVEAPEPPSQGICGPQARFSKNGLIDMTLGQLRDLAKARGIKGMQNAKESTLVAKHLEWQAQNLG